MNIDSVFEKGSHSYLIHGEPTEIFSLMTNHTRASEFSVTQFFYDRLSIDNAREIKNEASLLASSDTPRILFIGATDIGVEAEQALLKLFEEPPENAKIVLVTQKRNLLPTILSRLTDLGSYSSTSNYTSKFLTMSVPERLAYIQKLTKDSDDTELSRKEILAEVSALLEHARVKARAGESEWLAKLTDLQNVFLALQTRGTPTKMLLEHLAVTL